MLASAHGLHMSFDLLAPVHAIHNAMQDGAFAVYAGTLDSCQCVSNAQHMPVVQGINEQSLKTPWPLLPNIAFLRPLTIYFWRAKTVQ